MLKLQYFGHLMQRADSLEMTGKDWRQEAKRATEDEMVGWRHWLNGHEFKQTLGDSEGQGSLVCCYLWGHKESDTTEQMNNKWWLNTITYEQMYKTGYLANNLYMAVATIISRTACKTGLGGQGQLTWDYIGKSKKKNQEVSTQRLFYKSMLLPISRCGRLRSDISNTDSITWKFWPWNRRSESIFGTAFHSLSILH